MKCPKCGYQSFNHLITCKKCGRDLAGLQAKLGFGQIVVPALRNPARTTGAPASEYSGEESLEDYFRSIPEPDSEEAAVAAPLASPAPPVAEPPSNDQNHEESPETDTFPDGEEGEDTFPFPFDRMDADLDALQREGEGRDEPFVLDNSFDELDLGLPSEGEQPGQALPPSDGGYEKPERGEMQDPEESVADDFSFSAPQDAQEPEQDEDFFFSFEELNAELTDWKNVPSLPEGEEEEIDLIPARDTREAAGPDATLKPQSIEELPAQAPEPSRTGRPETAAVQPELAFIPIADDDWQTGEDAFPEETEQPPEPALGRRFGALLADLGVLAIVFALFLLAGEMVRVPTAAQWFRFNADILLDLAAPYFVLLFTLCFGYFTLFHYLVGQTPGKILKGLRVENPSGEPLSLAQAFLRSTGGLVMLLPAGLGFFSVVADRGRRGWNDRLANTRVVNKAAEDLES